MANIKKKRQVIILPTNEKANCLRGYKDKSLLFDYLKDHTNRGVVKDTAALLQLYLKSKENDNN